MPNDSTDFTNQDRLKSHADAFNGLLSLIPAKLYYGEDTSVRTQVVSFFARQHADQLHTGSMATEKTN